MVGIDFLDEIQQDPMVRGCLRGADASRKRRVQSRPFLVSEVEVLERFLASLANALVDRYICGGVLFAIFSRSRFGDLRVVEQYHEDIPQECPENGFIELHSASHKMRRKGDSLGLALPLGSSQALHQIFVGRAIRQGGQGCWFASWWPWQRPADPCTNNVWGLDQ